MPCRRRARGVGGEFFIRTVSVATKQHLLFFFQQLIWALLGRANDARLRLRCARAAPRREHKTTT